MSVYALIMAGGEGKRFWPLSSKSRPKQFLRLNSDKSLLTQTFERIARIVDKENIYVVTTRDYITETLKHLTGINPDNILSEPKGMNTGPCIYYGCRIISEIDKDASVIVLPADHAIRDEDKFAEAISYSLGIVSEKRIKGQSPLITFGVVPDRPDTGYGYIEKSAEIMDRSDNFESYVISEFREKPDEELAKKYLKSGNHFWNSGIFVWKVDRILSEYYIHSPGWKNYRDFDFNNPDQLALFYSQVKSAPVDKQILEKSENTVVIPADFGWSDIGTWESLDQFQRSRPEENIVRGNVITENTRNSFIYSTENRNIVTIGVENLIIVESEQGLLIMNKHESQRVKDVISKIAN